MCLGWKNSRVVNSECDEESEFTAEADLVELLDQQEADLIHLLINSEGTSRLLAWSELEQRRARLYWRPLKPLAELLKNEPNEVS